MAHNTTKMRLILIPTILLLFLPACENSGSISSRKAKELVLVNSSGSPDDPSFAYSLREDKTLVALKYIHGKVSETTIHLGEHDFDEMRRKSEVAYEEIKQTKKLPNLVRGANISIVLDGDMKNGATIDSYSDRYYSIEQLQSLFKMLEALLPDEYWKIHPESDQ